MNDNRPLISVVMPVYNAGGYLPEAIASILAQTYARFEFIIVDDGSSDGSSVVIREFAARDARIRPRFLRHHGQAQALNIGVGLARGELVAHMDNDDLALPERLAIQLDWMRRTGVDVCGGQLKRFGDQDTLLWFPESHAAVCRELLFRIGLHHGTSLVRGDIARAHPFNAGAMHTDYEMLTRLALCCRLGNVPQVLLKHRCHPRQAHLVYPEAFAADIRRFRRPYFHALFPDADEEDYAVLARVADKKPLLNLTDLERAGRWLARLAQTEDNFLRERMAWRWLAACRGSAHLGMDCHRIYREILPAFNVPIPGSAWRLHFQCALRMRTGSRSYTILRRIKGVFLPGGIRARPDGAKHQARNMGHGGIGRREPMMPASEAIRPQKRGA